MFSEPDWRKWDLDEWRKMKQKSDELIKSLVLK